MPSPAASPNILFLFPDQWRADTLRCAGHPVVDTPFIDEIAARGYRFTSAYSPSPTCVPARACLATGLTPNSTGRLGYQDFNPWPYTTFMHRLRDGGYQTMCSGKTHFHPGRARLGFEELALYESVWQDPAHPSDYQRWLARETGGTIRDTAEEHDSNGWRHLVWPHAEYLHPTNWTTQAAIDLLDRRDPTRPFFLQINWHRPHPPFDPPTRFWEAYRDVPVPEPFIGDWCADLDQPRRRIDGWETGRFDPAQLVAMRRAYYAAITHLDEQIGRLMRYLKGHRLLGNTWIVFSSDHGEMLGDHHRCAKAVPFEGSAKVPLLIAPPERWPWPQETRSEPVTLSDLAPTFLEMAELPVPAEMEGRSLLPLARPEPAAFPREFVHGEHAPAWQFVTDGREKFAWHSESGEEWFFDLESDPGEQRNLAGRPEHAGRVSVWRDRLVRVLETRPEDGHVADGRLVAGHATPVIRPFLAKSTAAD